MPISFSSSWRYLLWRSDFAMGDMRRHRPLWWELLMNAFPTGLDIHQGCCMLSILLWKLWSHFAVLKGELQKRRYAPSSLTVSNAKNEFLIGLKWPLFHLQLLQVEKAFSPSKKWSNAGPFQLFSCFHRTNWWRSDDTRHPRCPKGDICRHHSL